jgi:uncharacterized membrane protein YfcA
MEIHLPIAEMPVSAGLVLAMSAAVGFISGIFGIGGGFLMTPLLVFLGIPHAVAVATVAPQIAAASTTGLLASMRRGALDLRLGGVLLGGGIPGTLLGVLFFEALRRIGQLELVITLSYVLLLTAIGGLMLVESLRDLARNDRESAPRPRRRRPIWFALPLRIRFPRSGIHMSVLPPIAVAAAIGFVGAVLGIGGGFLVVPALIYLFRVPTAVAVGTSLFQILFSALAATVFHAATNRSVDMILAFLLILGGVFGAQFGARAARNVRGGQFRLLLALIVLAVAARFLMEIGIRPADPFSLGPTEFRS